MRAAAKNKDKEFLARLSLPEYVEIHSNHQVFMEACSLIYDVKQVQNEPFLDVMSKYRLHSWNSHPCMKCHMFLMNTPGQQEICAIGKETPLLVRLYTLKKQRSC